MLKLARKYRQKAIYAYSFEPAADGPKGSGYLVRDVIWVGTDYGRVDEGERTRMGVLPAPPRTQLADKDWQQP